MSECKALEPILTPFVDGELAADERARVEQHVRRCAPCYSRVAAERTVRELIHECRPALGACAPPALRARCCAAEAGDGTGAQEVGARSFSRSLRWSRRLTPLALAASLVVVVGGAFVYQATERSSGVMVAELTADHVKCFGMNAVLGTHDAPDAVESSMLGGFGWRMHMPEQLTHAGFDLIGSRPCLYGEGRIAHLMYRHDGHPVSIFMLPNVVRAEEVLEVMGHEAAVWSVGGRTFVLIAREPRAEVQRMASIVQAALR